jgi:hypothetical protein
MVGWSRLSLHFRFTPKAEVDGEGREVRRRANLRHRRSRYLARPSGRLAQGSSQCQKQCWLFGVREFAVERETSHALRPCPSNVRPIAASQQTVANRGKKNPAKLGGRACSLGRNPWLKELRKPNHSTIHLAVVPKSGKDFHVSVRIRIFLARFWVQPFIDHEMG